MRGREGPRGDVKAPDKRSTEREEGGCGEDDGREKRGEDGEAGGMRCEADGVAIDAT